MVRDRHKMALGLYYLNEALSGFSLLFFRLTYILTDPEYFADVLVVVGEGEEDGQHEEVAADDDVRFVTLCNSCDNDHL